MLKADISCLYEMWSRDARELVQYAKLFFVHFVLAASLKLQAAFVWLCLLLNFLLPSASSLPSNI